MPTTMRLRSSARRFDWRRLPTELRLMILEEITQQTGSSDWASAAAVCKEWQHFIEKRKLQRLNLRVPDLDNRERLTIRQRNLVRHISLDIELPTYKSSDSEPWGWSDRNSLVMSKGTWKLFHILSTWEPANGNGLTLELNAFSPSDSEHWFKNYHFVSDPESGQSNDCQWHDESHGWINGQQVETPPKSAILRLFELVSLDFDKEFPRVNAIRRFIIRRQFRRWIDALDLSEMLEKLCGLEQLVYEPWRPWDSKWRELRDKDFSLSVQRELPETLKSITVFEDFSRNLAAACPWVESSRVLDAGVGTAFARRSLELEHLSVSYMTDAAHFFQGCMPLGQHSDRESWTWQHLQSLALTSRGLRRTGNRREINALLVQAASVALRMPKLHTLVLWHDTDACAFIYTWDPARGARITWRGTWELDLDVDVVQMWQSVATKVHSCELEVFNERVDGVIRSHGDAIHHLRLPCQVATPASIWQIRQEHKETGTHNEA
ncbi:hypothetical protein CONLIGDRAFT_711518 [Coniochaeta ligniaria NRRL 30616]|uniref:DUF6546 domain-containing protein n=1 Tax=Coniochaeta ligniaria NRRL 30616 TaxID=1408157 RepID=A0A1J7J0Q8_9PEZI|nr:hypothetical protein CONLIGDRAFT_711518 [Coniochaeta ligniaria NRRL 30616]